MFGDELLNGKQLCERIGVSTTILYRLIANGMPFHQLTGNSRKYYNLSEVHDWLKQAGYRKKTTWTK